MAILISSRQAVSGRGCTTTKIKTAVMRLSVIKCILTFSPAIYILTSREKTMYRIFVDGKRCGTGVNVSCEAHIFGKVSVARKYSTRLF